MALKFTQTVNYILKAKQKAQSNSNFELLDVTLLIIIHYVQKWSQKRHCFLTSKTMTLICYETTIKL